MKVYHGSYIEIDIIDLSFCETGKDFGQGFYVTNLRKQAEIWANKKGKRKGNSGVVTEFEYNENLSRVMKLKTLYFDDYCDEWLEMEAADRYYTSNTYTQLANESNEFYLKPWQEIYELLKQEINNNLFRQC